MKRVHLAEKDKARGNVLTSNTSNNPSDPNKVPSPPDNPSKKPPMYSDNPHNTNDREH